jgi:REP element-mobilizing transposase RayT
VRPLAYHITWGTYGTRLRYGPRPTVSRDQNDFGAPALNYDQHLWEREKGNLKYPPVLLDRDQMRFIESMIPALCERGRWTLRTCAAGPDHVHKVLTSDQNPDTIRRLLKRWLGQALCDRYPMMAVTPDFTWWAESGSIKWIDDPAYLANATKYVTDQRATRT